MVFTTKRRFFAILPAVAAGIVVCATAASAITVNDILAFSGGVLDTGVVGILAKSESRFLNDGPFRPGAFLHDSLPASLLRTYRRLQCAPPGDSRLSTGLASGLIQIYLGEFGVRSSFDTARVILSKSAREFPGNRTVAWMQGLLSIQSGEITNGIRLLDSLRGAGFNDESFLKDYARYVFRALVPARVGTRHGLLQRLLWATPDTLSPATCEWNVVRLVEPGNKKRLPAFTYGATFEIRKPFHLVFTGLTQTNLSAMQIGYVRNPVPAVSMDRQATDRKSVASCRLFIDLNPAASAPSEYLSRRISGVYDSIEVKTDLRGFRGISLRCYRWPRQWYEDGTCTAVASFDRTFFDLRKKPGCASREKVASTIRYTLVVQSLPDVQDLVEAKFLSILRELL